MKAPGKQSEMQTLLRSRGVCAFREAAHTGAAHLARRQTSGSRYAEPIPRPQGDPVHIGHGGARSLPDLR